MCFFVANTTIMNKQQLIKKYLAEPLKAGDRVYAKGLSTRDSEIEKHGEVHSLGENDVLIRVFENGKLSAVPYDKVRKDISHIGANNFQPELRGTGYQIDIWQLLHRAGYTDGDNGYHERFEKVNGQSIPEICHNPMVIDVDGNEVEYQRGLVWTLEQKQLLIDSIYNNVEIGKFVIRRRKWSWVEKRLKQGFVKYTAFGDMVDGKQRLHAILEFVTNKFPDSYGNYWDDLSDAAQRKFVGYRQLSYVELDENSDDADVLKVFLAINFTGTPMSREHIDYVKSIQLK